MSDHDQKRAALRDIIAKRSFFRGDVTLASGKKSTFYFDMKPSMFDPEGADLMSDLILARLDGVACDLVGGLEMGAVPLISPVSIKSRAMGRPIPGFFVRKAVKDHGTKKLIDGVSNVSDVAGKSIVIVEDVTTTGQSAMQAVRALEASGAKITLVISIVDREDGAEDLYREAGIPFAPLYKAHEFF